MLGVLCKRRCGTSYGTVGNAFCVARAVTVGNVSCVARAMTLLGPFFPWGPPLSDGSITVLWALWEDTGHTVEALVSQWLVGSKRSVKSRG